MKKIIINKPEITSGYDENHKRLSAKIEGDNFVKDLYYEVEKEYEKYLCYERGDAFLIGLLYFAMINGYDMEIKVPISEKLYYQLTEQYIPTICKYAPEQFKKIKIVAKLDNKPIVNAGAVGTSASGGVDSFYTIIKNSNMIETNYNITHLMIVNFYSIYYGEKSTRDRFSKTKKAAERIAENLNLPLVAVYSNENEFWFKNCMELYCLRYAAYVFSLQKLFAVYNFSSGYEYKDFKLGANVPSDRYDFLTAQLISNENFTFYSSGDEASRLEKLEYIVNNPVVKKCLQVCNITQDNCSTCSKCMRTQLELWVLGKLDYYNKVFKTDIFYKNKNKELIKIIGRKNEYDREIIKAASTKKLIPISVKIIGNIKYYLWQKLKNVVKRSEFLTNWFLNTKLEHTNKKYETEAIIYSMDPDVAKKCNNVVL